MFLKEWRNRIMKGEDLIQFIQKRPHLLYLDISDIIKELLKQRYINPSTLIDAHVNILNEEKDKYKCHFIEADTCNYLLIEGDKEQKEFGRKRAMYNSKFNTTYKWTYKDKLSEEELKERKEYFNLIYGFNPEKDPEEE